MGKKTELQMLDQMGEKEKARVDVGVALVCGKPLSLGKAFRSHDQPQVGVRNATTTTTTTTTARVSSSAA